MLISARAAGIGFAVAVVAGCGDSTDDGTGVPECLPMLPRDCVPEPEPWTYPELYMDIFSTTCGTGATGEACHGRDAGNGLVLAGMDTAYDELLGLAEDGVARVIPGDPECSTLVHRLESDDPAFWMPRSPNKLNERQLCAVRRWIADGAERDDD